MGLDGKALARFARDAAGREVERLAGGIHQIQAFDPQGRLVRQEGRRSNGGAAGSETVYARAYGHDGADTLTAIEDARRGVTRYRYDACDRLLAVEESGRRGTTLTRFGYDAFGRRVRKESVHAGPVPANDPAPPRPSPPGAPPSSGTATPCWPKASRWWSNRWRSSRRTRPPHLPIPWPLSMSANPAPSVVCRRRNDQQRGWQRLKAGAKLEP
ncbi:RHS repeat domain-containing protein [Nitrospirillum sp. BR 11752]|uniref:RHS repeat domain-containing protein n=1 Tax=Nitrospirillum sp. BR 11752 TaxID=3104293 RepID=UPI002EAAD95D|nr:RHS repeat domain-containing protein [Nitrospirillum sp. BR 11752]